MSDPRETLIAWLISAGWREEFAQLVADFFLGISILFIAVVANWVTRKFLLAALSRVIRRSRTQWDDLLMEKGFFHRLSHLAPALILYFSAPLFPDIQEGVAAVALAYMGLIGLLVLGSFLDAVVAIYRTFEIARSRPIRGYVQAFKVFIYVLGGIAILATLMGESPWKLLSGIGALTAILLLVFKDSILGFVASIQISANDMLRIGDWIEMPKFGADGDVVDITIQCVKVQNWDKTVTTIPTYALVSDSFKNWRGMQEAGGRRIKRSIYVDMNSVKFCTGEMVERFRKIRLISGYIDDKLRDLEEYNRKLEVDPSDRVNARRLTNVGTLRAYLREYLKHHPRIHQGMTLLVRQLPPGENGLPIEIYVFTNDIRWSEYEAIQADIFDHILAVIPEFELRVFQRPSGLDMVMGLGNKKPSA